MRGHQHRGIFDLTKERAPDVWENVCSTRHSEHAQNTGGITVVLSDHADHLSDAIGKYSGGGIFGCVAWLTHGDILAELSRVASCGIIVQKEDFLRPDSGGPSKEALRQQYDAIKGFSRYEVPGAGELSYCSFETSGVRCAGYNFSDSRTYPRMHHKFLVFCRWVGAKGNRGEIGSFEPEKVWTGSYNFTNNGERSLENAVLIHDSRVAAAYLREFVHCLSISEPLDWNSEWVQPEYRWGS